MCSVTRSARCLVTHILGPAHLLGPDSEMYSYWHLDFGIMTYRVPDSAKTLPPRDRFGVSIHGITDHLDVLRAAIPQIRMA